MITRAPGAELAGILAAGGGGGGSDAGGGGAGGGILLEAPSIVLRNAVLAANGGGGGGAGNATAGQDGLAGTAPPQVAPAARAAVPVARWIRLQARVRTGPLRAAAAVVAPASFA